MNKEMIKKREIRALRERYEVRLESLSHIKDKLSSNFARIKQTLDKNRPIVILGLKETLKMFFFFLFFSMHIAVTNVESIIIK